VPIPAGPPTLSPADARVRRAFLSFALFRYAHFGGGIMVPFYLSIGLSLQDAAVFFGIQMFAWAAAGVPAGAIADRLGRIPMLALGMALRAAGYVALFVTAALLALDLGTVWLVYAAANVAIGIAEGCLTGPDSAYLYDRLESPARDRNFRDITGRNSSVRHVIGASAPTVGGGIAQVLGIPWAILASAVTCVGGLFALRLFPAEQARAATGTPRLMGAVREFGNNRPLRVTSGFLALTGAYLLTMLFVQQTVLLSLDLDVFWFGFAAAFAHLVAAAAALLTGAVARWPRLPTTLVLGALTAGFPLLAAIGVGLGGAAGIAIATVGLVSFSAARGLSAPIVLGWINSHAGSAHRASALALGYFAATVAAAIATPSLGSAIAALGIENVLYLMAALVVPLTAVLLPGIVASQPPRAAGP
jgi:MFS family permease